MSYFGFSSSSLGTFLFGLTEPMVHLFFVFILFSLDPSDAHDLDGKLYCMSSGGSAIERLSAEVAEKPTWAPDGRSILYVTHSENGTWFHLISPKGQDLMRIPVPPMINLITGISWAPDGTEIVFGGRVIEPESFDIYRMKLTMEPVQWEVLTDGIQPAWSPEGQRIVYTSSHEGNLELYLMDIDGRNPQNLTRHEGYDAHPSWSPDGRRIAFESTRFGNREICILELGTGEVTQVTDYDFGHCQYPEWSPSGKEILFSSNRGGKSTIYRMAIDGTKITKLTSGQDDDWEPAWSPNGERICFLSNRSEPLILELRRWFSGLLTDW